MLVILGACRSSAGPSPPASAPAPFAQAAVATAPASPRLAALLDVNSEHEAIVVALVKSKGWQSPELAEPGEIDRLAARGVSFQMILPASEEQRPAGATSEAGKLAGGTRTDCGDHFVRLARPAVRRGFAAVSVGPMGKDLAAATAPRLQSIEVEPAHAAAVSDVIKRVTKRSVAATVERAFRLDLDGNGKPELLFQATHPELNGDPAKLKTQYYSMIVVLHDGKASEAVFVGYLQAARDFADFEVLTLDSAADIDLDGKPELLVRARHTEGWQTQVFTYGDGRLKELFRSVGVEGECPEGKE